MDYSSLHTPSPSTHYLQHFHINRIVAGVVIAIIVSIGFYICIVALRHYYPDLFICIDSLMFRVTHPGLNPRILAAQDVFQLHRNPEDAVEECSICLEEFADGGEVRRLHPCGHSYHSSCSNQWFASHITCPMCWSSVTVPVPVPVPVPTAATGEA